MSNARMSAREIAAKFLAAKTAKSRQALVEDARSRCTGKGSSKKNRWERLANAMEANDRSTVERYADFAKWSAAQKAAKAAKPAAKKPASKAKPAAKAAKPAASKAPAKPDVRKVAEAFGVDPEMMAAFLQLAAK